jgi:SAM-dependent methyltransferase
MAYKLIKNIMKLNLGCGNDIKKNWINLDIADLPGVNVVHDINSLPLPFEKDIFDEILCQDVLEHVDYIKLLEDLHRILKPGGALKIRVPHFSSVNNFIDPTHKNRFSIKTFDFFVNSTILGKNNYYFNFAFSGMIEKRITFDKKNIFIHRYFIEKILNSHINFINIYERTCLCYLFPSENIIINILK